MAIATSETGQVALNHFYLTVDPATYAAIARHSFLRGEFAPSEERTTVRTDRTYTGLYFYGRNTYWEFFDAGVERGHGKGDSGIAFGADGPGTLAALAPALDPELRATVHPTTREWNGRQWPWFEMLQPEIEEPSILQTWLMEYDPRFLESWRPEPDLAANRGIGRARILERYARVLPSRPERPYLDDVESIAISLDPLSAGVLRRFASGLRLAVDGGSIRGPGVEIAIREEAQPGGITAFRVRLRGSAAFPEALHLGSSTLKLCGEDRAEWTF